MRNPLWKRLPREFVGDFGKYAVIFLFMTLTIGFISGFLVAGGSMKEAYDESFEKYHIENGHFVLMDEWTEELADALAEEEVSVYPDYYIEEESTSGSGEDETDNTLRIFYNRQENNQVCLMEGELPEKADEIAIDRMYADNNEIAVGDAISVGGKNLTVTGLVALSDYSALFSDTTDMMFDAMKFGVAVMTEEGFHAYGDAHLFYNYCWYYDEEPENESAEKERSDDLMEVIAAKGVLRTYLPRYANSAINFTGDDMGGDRSLMLILLYILIVILAFIFAVTIHHTITKESATIGTLRAMGYTKWELLSHYMALPMMITLLAAVIGNVLGYTAFKYMVVAIYYNSYSLTTYNTIWNAQAFVLTTVVPLILMFLVNLLSLIRALGHTPLQFIRRDIGNRRQKRLVRLPNFSFIHRFRIRIVLQNTSSFATIFVGIVFANVLLLFGLMMHPLLDHYQELVVDSMLSKYQYVLKAPVETEIADAEKYSVTTLKILKDSYDEEEIMTYGISEDSEYLKADLYEDGVVISNGIAEKFRLKEGDAVTLRDAYGSTKYTFTIKGIIDYPAILSIFMPQKLYEKNFDVETDSFNGYFTDEELSDVDEAYIASCITKDDLTKTSRQLEISMGNMFWMLSAFAVVIFILIVYLLTKLIIEKNAQSISMTKILGYQNGQIASLYLMAVTWVVILSIIIGIGIATVIIDYLYFAMMKDYNGWLTIYIDPKVYAEMFVLGLVCYAVVAVSQFIKIRRIPMDSVLKNVE